MLVEITKAQQVSEEMISVDIELLDEELDAVAGGVNDVGTVIGSQGDNSTNTTNIFVSGGNFGYGHGNYNHKWSWSYSR